MNILQQPDALSLSQNLKDFLITSDVQISFVLKQGGVEVLSQRYDPPAEGAIVISLRDVVHERLSYALKDSSAVYQQFALVDNFTAVINTTEVTFRVIRAGVDRMADSATHFLTQNFLTWQPSTKPVTYYSPEFLTYYTVVPGTSKLRAYFTDASGTATSQMDYTISDLLPGIAYTIPLQYSVVAGWLGHKLPAYYDVWVENATGQRLTYIQRYYAEDMRSEQEQWILFENSLGGLDTFRAYGDTTFNGEHTHNLAEIDEVSQEYRVDTERKFQKNTGHLNRDERKWLLDFFPSKGKYCYTGNFLRPIVVIESNVSYTDKELPSNYTFTFKYADARPLLNLPRTDVPADVLSITVPSVGSFTVPPRLAEFPRLPLSEGALFPVQSPYSEEWGTTTASSLVCFVAENLSLQAGDSGDIGHKHQNIDLLNLLSYKQNYLYIAGQKAIVGYADKTGYATEAEYAYLAHDLDKDSPVFDIINNQLNCFLRKDQPDSTLYPVDFMGGLSINSKHINNVIRYYDETKPVSTDANIYSALMTDQRIEEEFEGLDDRYLRKDKEDFAHKHITFEEGITVYELAQLMNLDVKNLATIAKAVVSILRSSKFVDGFSGEGYQIWQDIASGDWNLTIDRVTVRKVMTIYELIVQKLRSVGGMVVVSAANGKVKSIEKIGSQYLFTFEDANQFQPNDLMRCQVFSSSGLKYYWVKVAAVSGESVIVPVSEFEGIVPTSGDECVLMGNTTNKRRQGLIIISATEDGQPRFDCLNGVNSKSFEGCLKVRVGNLDGISDSRFPSDMQPSGHGIYGNNCFLTGVFVLSNGKDVMTMFSIMEGMIKAEVSSVRNEVNAKDNYLSNASFAENLKDWTGSNHIRLFTVNRKLLYLNNNLYANKIAFANIVNEGGKNVLRLKDGSITQQYSDYASHPEFQSIPQVDGDGNPVLDEEGNQIRFKRPRMFYISFKYLVKRTGTLSVCFQNESSEELDTVEPFEPYKPINYIQTLFPSDDFKTMEISGKWNGRGDFFLSFSGDMYLYSLAVSDNPLADLEEKFNSRFELTEKKLQLNFDEIKKTGTKLEEYHSQFLLTARNLEIKFREDLSDTENRITSAYKSYVNLTARDLRLGFEADIDSAESRITEAYTSAIKLSAQGLETRFTADITDMEAGITSAYKSWVELTAQHLQAGFTEDLTDLRTGVTEAYKAAIDVSARGLRTDFNSSISNINGILSSHSSSLQINADEIRGLVSTTSNLGGRLSTAESSIRLNSDAIATKVSSTDFSREIDNSKILAASATGTSLYNDPTFRTGNNGITVYNNAGGSAVTITRKLIAGVPNDTGYGLELMAAASGDVTPGWGGFCFCTQTKANRLLVCRFTANVPIGYTVNFSSNATGSAGVQRWLTATAGTGKWQEYAFYVQCGTAGTFSSTFFFYLTGSKRPVTWQLAQANVYELSAQDLASKYSQIKQTLDSISLDIYDGNGKFAILKATVDDISSLIGDGTGGNFSQLTQKVDSIKLKVDRITLDASGNVSNISRTGITTDVDGNYLFATKAEFSQQGTQIGNVQTAINQTAESVSVITGRFNADGTLKEGSKWITTTYGNQWLVKKDGIISAINQSAESVTIDAKYINLNGAITANNRFKIKLDGSIESADAIMNNVTVNNMILKGNITGVNATLADITVNNGIFNGELNVKSALNTIRISPKNGSLTMFDLTGREMASLASSQGQIGVYPVYTSQLILSSGVYESNGSSLRYEAGRSVYSPGGITIYTTDSNDRSKYEVQINSSGIRFFKNNVLTKQYPSS